MSEWISVADRVPDNEDNVLVIHYGVHEDPIRAFFCTDTLRFFAIDSCISFPLSVTHWTPIPKFPQREKLKDTKQEDWLAIWTDDDKPASTSS